MQTALAAAAVALQQLLRWAHLALLALHLLRAGTAPQLAYAGPAAGSSGDNGEASASAAPRAAAPADQQQQQPIVPVIDFLSAATTGAVEHLRHTLMDAGAGLEPKMRALERTASSVQDTLFQAARAHSEAVRSNPQGEQWGGGRRGSGQACCGDRLRPWGTILRDLLGSCRRMRPAPAPWPAACSQPLPRPLPSRLSHSRHVEAAQHHCGPVRGGEAARRRVCAGAKLWGGGVWGGLAGACGATPAGARTSLPSHALMRMPLPPSPLPGVR